MDEAALQLALEEIDAEGNGMISFDEFDQWCALGPQLLQGGRRGEHEGAGPADERAAAKYYSLSCASVERSATTARRRPVVPRARGGSHVAGACQVVGERTPGVLHEFQ